MISHKIFQWSQDFTLQSDLQRKCLFYEMFVVLAKISVEDIALRMATGLVYFILYLVVRNNLRFSWKNNAFSCHISAWKRHLQKKIVLTFIMFFLSFGNLLYIKINWKFEEIWWSGTEYSECHLSVTSFLLNKILWLQISRSVWLSAGIREVTDWYCAHWQCIGITEGQLILLPDALQMERIVHVPCLC